MENTSVRRCDNKCIHADVCKYKDDFEHAAKAVLNATVQTVADGHVNIKKIASYEISVGISCDKYAENTKFSTRG